MKKEVPDWKVLMEYEDLHTPLFGNCVSFVFYLNLSANVALQVTHRGFHKLATSGHFVSVQLGTPSSSK